MWLGELLEIDNIIGVVLEIDNNQDCTQKLMGRGNFPERKEDHNARFRSIHSKAY
jgi:hypothetical protein